MRFSSFSCLLECKQISNGIYIHIYIKHKNEWIIKFLRSSGGLFMCYLHCLAKNAVLIKEAENKQTTKKLFNDTLILGYYEFSIIWTTHFLCKGPMPWKSHQEGPYEDEAYGYGSSSLRRFDRIIPWEYCCIWIEELSAHLSWCQCFKVLEWSKVCRKVLCKFVPSFLSNKNFSKLHCHFCRDPNGGP